MKMLKQISFVKIILLFGVFLTLSQSLHSNTIIVDPNGSGFTKIQDAINAALINDTVKVYPGTYIEAINLNKNIVVIGSGCENTIITGANTQTILMSAGKLMWFYISSTGGYGIKLSYGTVSNCLIKGCSSDGINISSPGYGYINNCVIVNNGGYGINASSTYYSYVVNCISRNNTSNGYRADYYAQCIALSYSCGSQSYTSGNQGCFDADPLFIASNSNDYRLAQSSPCFNSGNPSLFDPDGSRCDMGYFGGPECPIYPVVYEIIMTPSGNNVNIQAKGKANY